MSDILIIEKLNIILKKLENIEKRLGNCENSCNNMDIHIGFVKNTYSIVKQPLQYIIDKVSFTKKELPQIKN
tara:strand:+ start:244 stop:459 length:216 start_codon:yes stop_codon:yes gene_type:complete